MADTIEVETEFGALFELINYDDSPNVAIGSKPINVKFDEIKFERSGGSHADNLVWFYRNGSILDHLYVSDYWSSEIVAFLDGTNVEIDDER